MERSRRARSRGRGRGRGSQYRRKNVGRLVHTPTVAPCQSSDNLLLDESNSGSNLPLSKSTRAVSEVSDKNVIRINPPVQLQRRLEFMRTTGLGHIVMSNAPITRSMVNSQSSQSLTGDKRIAVDKNTAHSSEGKSEAKIMDGEGESTVNTNSKNSKNSKSSTESLPCAHSDSEKSPNLDNFDSKTSTPSVIGTGIIDHVEKSTKSPSNTGLDSILHSEGEQQSKETMLIRTGQTPTGALSEIDGLSPNLFMGLPDFDTSFLQNPGAIIGKHERGDIGAMSDALNKIHAVMVMTCQILSAYRIDSDRKISELSLRNDRVESDVSELQGAVANQKVEITSLGQEKVSKCELDRLEQKYDDLRSYCDQMFDDHTRVIEKQQKIISNFDLGMLRMVETQRNLCEKQNVYEIRQNHLMLTIDGLPEVKDKSTSQVIVDRLNADGDVGLELSDFTNSFRVGKPRIAKKKGKGKNQPTAPPPRQIKVQMASIKAKDSVLACRGNIKQNEDKSYIWINEEHPDDYRRRKIMLRDLVKHISKNTDHTASIEMGGLKLDDQFYSPDQLNDLPYDCHPERVQILETNKNGLVFAGPWAYLSNMYPTSFEHDEIMFTSSEQCIQFHKAVSHNDQRKADKILVTNHPFKCKKMGDKIDDSEDWIASREKTIYDIIRSKFEQNGALFDKLLDTGDKKLFEANIGPTWGINASLKSKAAHDHSGTGKNRFGRILMRLRSDFGTGRTGYISGEEEFIISSDSESQVSINNSASQISEVNDDSRPETDIDPTGAKHQDTSSSKENV